MPNALLDEKKVKQLIGIELEKFRQEYLEFRSWRKSDTPTDKFSVTTKSVTTGQFFPSTGGTINGNTVVSGTFEVTGNLGFYGTSPIGKPTVSGSKGGNVALASLMSALSSLGIVTDSTT